MPNATLQTAQYLTERSGGSTREDLCAAISTTYYALFETLAKLSADLLVGYPGQDRTEKAWMHVYRSQEHTRIASKCGGKYFPRFPENIKNFSEFFLQLQFKRQQSDYEYGYNPDLTEVRFDIGKAEFLIEQLLQIEEKHLRAFCLFILFEKHRHDEEPKTIRRN